MELKFKIIIFSLIWTSHSMIIWIFRIKIAQGAMVCKEIKVKGQVSFGASTIIHPGVTLIAEAGPIEIGENNIVEEYVNIIHKWVSLGIKYESDLRLNWYFYPL